ncbi:MAG: DUF2182 domain-containing protein [Marinovum algicola]|uniref:Predicted metal-binding membrane protein n=2 Tax=Roseobacteraceae TaxID=2854170 RepID=A0A975ZQ00_9RHOB|nr:MULTISPECIES: DUF2182 domain-containing protein [Marinovum]MDD9739468.1 DUF2182 domain-containing protein [Marinovum sp. SP66]SEJ98915.1 Predicted metal-binding membrane protein [Marinovum algicola]SLN70750.1 hypothetical protein MAA5396_03908 [Marinovum algicola]
MTARLRITTPARRERLRTALPLALLALPAWGLLALGNTGLALSPLCSPGRIWSLPSPESLGFFFTYVPPGTLALGWALMVAAMMLPTLLPVLGHVRARTFADLRPVAECLVLAGYFGVWMAAGVGLIGLALGLRLLSGVPLWPLALGLALLWQASPAKQRALNRCHRRPVLAGFAPRLWRDALWLGARSGGACLTSCAPLMLLGLMLPGGHFAVMLALSLWIWAERLEPPRPPGWRFCWPRRALRLLRHRLAQPHRRHPETAGATV